MSFIMSYFPLFVLTATIQLVSGCNSYSSTADNGTILTQSAGTVTESRKLAIISTAALSTIRENSRVSDMQQVIEFSKNGHSVAYIEPYDGLFRVVHEGRPGKPYSLIDNLAISSDGKRVAYVVKHTAKLRRIVIDGWEGPFFGDIGMPLFSQDGRHILYSASQGDIYRLVVDNKVHYEYSLVRNPVISADSTLIAFSVKAPDGKSNQLIISDMSLQNKTVFDACGDYLVKSNNSAMLGVVCSEGGKRSVKVIDFIKRTIISSSEADDRITRLKFSSDNKSLVYSMADDDWNRAVVYNGREEAVPTGDELFSDPHVLSEQNEVGVIIGTVYKARLYRPFQKNRRSEREYGYISDFVSSRNGRHYAYVAVKINQEKRHIVVDGNEGPLFDKIVDPVFSPDERLLVYRARQSGKRFIIVSDLKGKIISQHRDYDMVFHPIFLEDSKSVAYGVLDGNELWWKVEKL